MVDARKQHSNKAYKLLERTRRSRAGWGQAHYSRLFRAFGFLPREGGKHTIYWDPGDKSNRVQVPRHNKLKAYVANQAISAIERMLSREALDQ